MTCEVLAGRWCDTVRARSPVGADRSVGWVAGGVVLAVVARLPYLNAPLGRDEGGDVLVALADGGAGPFAYGPYFLDRPPLLVALYGFGATVGGDLGVRALGLIAACAVVVLVAAVARELAGAPAVPFAALGAAALVSSQATTAVYTPAELLAIVPTTAAVLLVVRGLERGPGTLWLAGIAAGLAVMVKQSFADGLVAGAAALAAARPGRVPIIAYLGGVAAVGAAVLAWSLLAGVRLDVLWYALAGFRIDAVPEIATVQADGGPIALVEPALRSGLALAVAAALVGVLGLRGRPERVALAVWLLVGLGAIVVSGSNYPPYLIQLVPVAAIGAAVALARRARVGAVVLTALVAVALLPTARAALNGSAGAVQREAEAIGRYVAARAQPGQTAYVLYAQANVLRYTGLPSPFAYHWALMMRAAPGAEADLRALLESPQRPTWIVAANRTRAFGLDRDGATRRLLRRHYRPAGTACGTEVLLAADAAARPAPRALACP